MDLSSRRTTRLEGLPIRLTKLITGVTEPLFEESEKIPLGEPLTLGEVTTAFVQDTAVVALPGIFDGCQRI
jgi:hypothetical protein